MIQSKGGTNESSQRKRDKNNDEPMLCDLLATRKDSYEKVNCEKIWFV